MGAAAKQRSIVHDIEEPHVATRRRRGEASGGERPRPRRRRRATPTPTPTRPRSPGLPRLEGLVPPGAENEAKKMKMYHERKVKSIDEKTETE